MLPDPQSHEFINTPLTSPTLFTKPVAPPSGTDLNSFVNATTRHDNNSYLLNNWGANSGYSNYYYNNNQQSFAAPPPPMVLGPPRIYYNQNVHVHLNSSDKLSATDYAADLLPFQHARDASSDLSGTSGDVAVHAQAHQQAQAQIEEEDRSQADPSSMWRPYYCA